MENIFKLKGEELEEYHKAINLLARYYNYGGYKWLWNIVTKEAINLDDIEGVLILDRPYSFAEDDTTDEEYEAYESVYDFLTDTFYREVGKYCDVEDIDTYDKQFPRNPYYTGYKISYGERSLCFYDAYTGVAGCHWETLAFDHWFE